MSSSQSFLQQYSRSSTIVGIGESQKPSRTASILRHRPSNPTPKRAQRRSSTPKFQAKHVNSPFFFCRSPFRQFFLLISLFFYQFAGALLFLICEADYQKQREQQWEEELDEKRRHLAEKVGAEIGQTMANGTVEGKFEEIFEKSLLSALIGHDQMLLEWRGKHPQMRWDFWNSMLFSLSIFTTIGYGHLSARTKAGRILTMLYALGGIPLLMVVLEELGALFSRLLRASWFLVKCACRRAFRNCTRQTSAEIRTLDSEDRNDLRNSAELPLAIALFALFSWISICAAVICFWERQWDFGTAFYFFFTSLATIGLGDIFPTQPKYSLLLTGAIIIGLAFVSMTIGLMQAKCVGRVNSPQNSIDYDDIDRNNNGNGANEGNGQKGQSKFANPLLRRNHFGGGGSSLGIFSTNTSSSRGSAIRERLRQRQWHNKCTQTVLCFPNPAIRNARITKAITQNELRMLPRPLSIDDVMRLVDTEEGDILLLSELTLSRETSEGISGLSDKSEGMNGGNGRMERRGMSSSNSGGIWSSESLKTTTSGEDRSSNEEGEELEGNGGRLGNGRGGNGGRMVVSRSFDHCRQLPTTSNQNAIEDIENGGGQFPSQFQRTFLQHQQNSSTFDDFPLILPIFSSIFGPSTAQPTSMSQLELLEELEDRMLFFSNVGGAGAGRIGGHQNRQPQMMASFEPGEEGEMGGVHFRSRLSLIPEQPGSSPDEDPEATIFYCSSQSKR